MRVRCGARDAGDPMYSIRSFGATRGSTSSATTNVAALDRVPIRSLTTFPIQHDTAPSQSRDRWLRRQRSWLAIFKRPVGSAFGNGGALWRVSRDQRSRLYEVLTGSCCGSPLRVNVNSSST